METTRLFLIDDQQVFVDAVALTLRSLASLAVVGSAAPDDPDLVDALEQHRPDVVTVEVDAVPDSVDELVARIGAVAPKAHLVALTASQDPALAVRCALAGFDGWVGKDSPVRTLLDAVHAVRRGWGWYDPVHVSAMLQRLRETERSTDLGVELSTLLSGREFDVLGAMLDGADSRQIAARLHVSHNTVRTHRRHIFRKLKVHSAIEVVRIARAAGIEPVRAAVPAAYPLSRKRAAKHNNLRVERLAVHDHQR